MFTDVNLVFIDIYMVLDTSEKKRCLFNYLVDRSMGFITAYKRP